MQSSKPQCVIRVRKCIKTLRLYADRRTGAGKPAELANVFHHPTPTMFSDRNYWRSPPNYVVCDVNPIHRWAMPWRVHHWASGWRQPTVRQQQADLMAGTHATPLAARTFLMSRHVYQEPHVLPNPAKLFRCCDVYGQKTPTQASAVESLRPAATFAYGAGPLRSRSS